MRKFLIHLLVLSCKKATLYIEKGHAKPLTALERMQLRFHLKLCDGCVKYQQQSQIIENALKSYQKPVINTSGLTLSEDFKTQVQTAINQYLKND